MSTGRLKIFLNYFLGPILFIWLSYSIYNHIISQPNWRETLNKILSSMYGAQSWKVVLVIVLMLFNWGVEAKKWQVLVKHLHAISFGKSFKAILAGVSLAMNTPNRVGEYFGRVIYIEEGNRLRAIALTFVGSISQLIVTFFFGVTGLVILKFHLQQSWTESIGFSVIWINATIYILSFGLVGLLLVYFRLSWLIKLIEKIPFIEKYRFYIEKLEEFEWRELLKVLLLSVLRYLIFIAQYILLLQVFDVNIGIWNSSWLTAVMFLVLAVVPTIALAELGLRGQVSLHLFGLLSQNSLGIVFTATGIWLINLVVPALAGSLFILGIKLFRKK